MPTSSPYPSEMEIVARLAKTGFEWTCENGRWGFYHLRDRELKYLQHLRTIAFLDLFESCEPDDRERVSDKGLSYIRNCKSLQILRLGPGITDGGLRHLSGLTNLIELRLDNAEDVTDIGVQHLASLTKLECLSLQYTGIADASSPLIFPQFSHSDRRRPPSRGH